MNIKSAIIIGISIIISFAIITIPLYQGSTPREEPTSRYEVTRVNDVYFILTDTETGQCWARRTVEHQSWDGKAPK